jgi:UDP-GlcNAc:undecaprenyl-phosphate/decaprenyl-phosphate GlcNAc-1-phosphate transferase
MGLSLSTALAFAVTAVLTLMLRPLALRVGITDKPGGRKQHIGEIPLVGGIAMFIGIFVAAMTAVPTTGLWTLLVPAALLVIVGVIDDRYNVGVSARIAAQTCAVLVMMIGGGLYLRDIGDPFGTGRLGLGILAIPVSVLVALSVVNAFNFIDGIDGLAASMALIGLAAAGLATGLTASAVSVAAMACGAILGFLLFNFPAFRNRRLRTFMGDAGSTLLGFVVVWFALSISQGADRSMSPVAALWFALMPLSDFFSCVVRRVARGKMPLHAGREHFHYVLMRAGLSGRQALAVLLAFSVLYAAVGLIGVRSKLPDWALFAPWFTLLASQSFIIRGLAVHLRHRRWRASNIVVKMPAVAATHSYGRSRTLGARQCNGQGASGARIQPEHDEAPLQPLGESARPIEAHAPERGSVPARRGYGE